MNKDTNKDNKECPDRRKFLKTAGKTAAIVSAASLIPGCKPKKNSNSGIPSANIDDLNPEELTHRINPHTGDKVSLLGYGCMRLPMTQISETEEEIDQETWNDLVDLAIESGVNYFDTAPIYSRGKSEKATGIALSRHPRDKYFIATKLSTFRENSDKSFEGSVAMYHNSMKELQVDYIDYYLLHAIGLGGVDDFNKRFIENGVLDFLLKERQAGRIRNLGWSFHGDVAAFDHLLEMDIQWDFAQIQMNYIDWEHATGRNVNAKYLYRRLVEHNVPAIVMEPLLGGRLAKLDFGSRNMLSQGSDTGHSDASTASWAFRYAGTPKHVLTVLSGMTYKEHLIDNLLTYSPLKPLSEKEYKLLERVTENFLRFPFIACNECSYCMPCPYGIDIPNIFRHYNKCLNEGNFPTDENAENYAEARRAFLIGYDRTVPKLRQANHCTGCAKCVPLCPQRLNIPVEMTRVDTLTEKIKQNQIL